MRVIGKGRWYKTLQFQEMRSCIKQVDCQKLDVILILFTVGDQHYPYPSTAVQLMCSIPDDHIDPRRWALFAARWVLGDSRKEKRHARTTA